MRILFQDLKARALGDERGMSLIEILVAAGLMVIISLGLTTVMHNMQRDQNSVKYRSDSDILNEEMRALLSSQIACTNSFGGLDPSASSDITALRDGTTAPGNVTYSKTDTYGDRSVRLKAMTFSKNTHVVGPLPPNTAQMTLTSTMETTKVTSGPSVVPREINISATLDGSGNIMTCIALAKMSDGIWRISPTNDANIYYEGASTGGYVGIGTTDPGGMLDIHSTYPGVLNFIYAENHSNNVSAKTNIGLANDDPRYFLNMSINSTAYNTEWGRNAGGIHGNVALLFIANESLGSSSNIIFATNGPAERMRVDPNGYVGIGTANPLMPLQINTIGPGGTASGPITFTAGDPSIGYNAINTGTAAYNFATSNFAAVQSFDPTNGKWYIESTATSGVSGTPATLKPRLSIEKDGSVEIGTNDLTAPIALADGLGPMLFFGGNTTANTDPIYFQRNNYALDRSELRLVIGDNGNIPVVDDQFTIGALDSVTYNFIPRMTVKSTGNVGIGTTNPVHLFEAVMSGATNQLQDDMGIISYTTVTDPSLYTYRGRGTSSAPQTVTSGDVLGNLIFGGHDGTSLKNAAQIVGNAETDFSTSIDGAISFQTVAAGVNSEKMRITSGGNIGIGIATPSYKLDVQGGDINASGSVRAAGVALTSDIRYKQNIEPLNDSLTKILNLRGVSYDWRSVEYPDKHFKTQHQIGVIAQEVEKEYPELVETDKEGFKSVNYPALIAPMIESIRELLNKYLDQQKQIDSQREQIKSLQKSVQSLKNLTCNKDPSNSICKDD